jgi:hypothetical protein
LELSFAFLCRSGIEINSIKMENRVEMKKQWLAVFVGLLAGCSHAPMAAPNEDEATLLDLQVSQGALSPTFAPLQTSYTADEPYLAETVMLTPTAKSPKATIAVNGQPVLSGMGSQAIPLLVGMNPITVEVGTPDGQMKRYDVLVLRAVPIEFLKASNPHDFDHFGYSVSLSGDTLAVGAINESSNATGGVPDDPNAQSFLASGAVYVFTRSGPTWTQQAYLKATDPNESDFFGVSVSLSGDSLAVGAYGEDSNTGAVYIFTRSGTTWSHAARLQPLNLNQDDFFGVSVSLSGDSLAVGAYGGGAEKGGSVYVFTGSGASWEQQGYLQASNPDTMDLFGYAVSLSGDTLAVGAVLEDSSATGVGGDQADNQAQESGAAYIFTRSGTNWTQQAYLKASNTNKSDRFGTAVSLSNDTLAVAAYHEDSSATGVNGNEADGRAPYSGAVYVFTRSGTDWTQQAYLKASNTDTGDAFGFSVSLVGDTLAVGAYLEDSNATGVDGNQDDNQAEDSGAVYLFTRSASNWRQQALFKASKARKDDWFGHSVSLSGDTLAVGALLEGSDATGVGSTQESGATYLYEIK